MLDENIEKLPSDEVNENIKKETNKNEDLESLKEDVADVKEEATEVKNESGDIEVDSKENNEFDQVKKQEETAEVKNESEDIEADSKENNGVDQSEKQEETTKNKETKVSKKVLEESSDNVIDEPKSIEKDSVKKKEKLEVPIFDFTKFNLDELVDSIQNLLDKFPIQDVKNRIESMKIDFSKKFKIFISEKKEEFIKEGGNEIDFHYSSPVKSKFNDLIREFKKKRQQYYKDIEKEQKSNLDARKLLIEHLKDLIDNAEASTMYKKFRVLQDEWRGIGQIPHTKYNDVWRTYHHHVERFYDLLHLNNDFRDLDFKHNLEEKSKLVEKAEALAENVDVNHAFKELQILHRFWKEDIGPVSRELRDEIWDRFSAATKKIHQNRHEYQDKLDAKLFENVDLKIAVIDKIKKIDIDNITSHKLWQDNIRNLEALRNEFFATGRVPKSKNEEIWQLFKSATRNFNKAKNSFYKSIKSDQLDNLQKKMHLVEQAESLKESEDYDITTDVYKKIQSEWKNIGHVPRKDSDKIWKRFKDACNHYFDRLHDKQDGADKEKTEVFNKKKDLLNQFKDQVEQEKILTLDLVNEYIKNWRDLGTVPMKLRHVDSKFNKALDVAYKKLNIDKKEAIFLKFKNNIDSYLEQNDVRKLDNEQLFIRRKIDELTKEIKQLENNISFISNASEDNPLIKNVYKNIENYHKDLEVWKKKISYMNQLDY